MGGSRITSSWAAQGATSAVRHRTARARRIMSAGSQGPDATQRYRTCQTRALTSRGVRITVSPLPEWAVRAVPRTPEVHHAVLASLLHPVARRVSPRILRNVSSAAGAAATAFVAAGSAASAGRLAAGPARPAAGALAGREDSRRQDQAAAGLQGPAVGVWDLQRARHDPGEQGHALRVEPGGRQRLRGGGPGGQA